MQNLYRVRNQKTGEVIEGTGKEIAEVLEVTHGCVNSAYKRGTRVLKKWDIEKIGDVQYTNICVMCGKEFKSDNRMRYCSKNCNSLKLENDQDKKEKVKGPSVLEINKMALKAGMSYGQYVARMGL